MLSFTSKLIALCMLLMVACSVSHGMQNLPSSSTPKKLRILIIADKLNYSHYSLNVKLAEVLSRAGHHVVCFHVCILKYSAYGPPSCIMKRNKI